MSAFTADLLQLIQVWFSLDQKPLWHRGILVPADRSSKQQFDLKVKECVCISSPPCVYLVSPVSPVPGSCRRNFSHRCPPSATVGAGGLVNSIFDFLSDFQADFFY